MKNLLIIAFVSLLTSNLFAQINAIDTDSISFNSLELALKNTIKNELKLVEEKQQNSLKIVSFTPIQNLKDNETYTFTVVVVYNLVSNEKGILNIGHNDGIRTDSFRLIEELSKIINKGSGYHIFKVTAKALDLSSIGAAFFISTNLSEYPHSERWRPLAGDRFVLKVN